MLAMNESTKCPEMNRNSPMITPMTVMPPNLPRRAASSMYTQPEMRAAMAGRKMEPKPPVNRVLTSVAMHTITQYRASNTPMVMRSETSSLPDLAGLLGWSEVSAGVFGAVTMFPVSYALTIFLSPI